MTERLSVGLIGAGVMGGALLRNWLKKAVIEPSKSVVFDPNLTDDVRRECIEAGLGVSPGPPPGTPPLDVLVVAVKPQAARDVLAGYADLAQRALVLSIMAGRSVDAVANDFGSAPRVVRAMPNLAALFGAGAAGLYAPDRVAAPDRAVAERLMTATGAAVWVDSEDALDAVTAVSGSGPAYFLAMTEALETAGVAAGLSTRDAAALARATCVGVGAMLAGSTASPGDWRDRVTSKGGSTAAALEALQGADGRLDKLVGDTVAAAKARAEALRG
ncbi:MAG: pyrroline-5-carboxylate reductase [Pseudomonadota bacterium]